MTRVADIDVGTEHILVTPQTSSAAAEGEAPRLTSPYPRVVGLDPSLTSTGLASSTRTLAVVPRAAVRGLPRLRHITDAVLGFTAALQADLVLIEGYIPGKAQAGVHERGGLWWRLVDQLDAAGYAVATVKPQAVKLYATGKGNANKDEVLLAAARRFPWFEGGNDEADALWLAAIGWELLGTSIVDMPARNREALLKAEWICGRRPCL